MSSLAHDQFDATFGSRRGIPGGADPSPASTPSGGDTPSPADDERPSHEQMEALPIGGKLAARRKLGIHTETDADGTLYWFGNKGVLHYDNGPAVVHTNGKREWYKDGSRHRRQDDHRDAGPAVYHDSAATVNTSTGSGLLGLGAEHDIEYWHLGQRHRTDGPAVLKADGSLEWYVGGRLHRTDGPALVGPQGEKAYYVSGHGCSGWREYRRERRAHLRNRRNWLTFLR